MDVRKLVDAQSHNSFLAVDPPAATQPIDQSESALWEFSENDILCGRGAFVNSNPGNKRFRALCFASKAEFDAGNPAAKRRIALDIVRKAMESWGARFLRRENSTSPWVEMGVEAAQQKAQQVMRDYRRPDRDERDKRAKKRNSVTATPLFDDLSLIPTLPGPVIEPYVEVLAGVHPHDILLGRGAFVNSHLGNARLRQMALDRKELFDSGSFTEKRTLAAEIVQKIRELNPPGRFLRKASPIGGSLAEDHDGWEEVSDETAIHKACQAMRDINRPDREYRLHRKRQRQLMKEGKIHTPPKQPAPQVFMEKIANSSVFFHHTESADDMFHHGLVAEALDGALESIPMPRMDGT